MASEPQLSFRWKPENLEVFERGIKSWLEHQPDNKGSQQDYIVWLIRNRAALDKSNDIRKRLEVLGLGAVADAHYHMIASFATLLESVALAVEDSYAKAKEQVAETIDDYRERLEIEHIGLNTYKNANDKLTAELAETKKQLADSSQCISELVAEQGERSEKLSSAKNEIAGLRAQLDKAKSEVLDFESMRAENLDLREKQVSHAEELAKAQRTISELEVEVRRLTAQSETDSERWKGEVLAAVNKVKAETDSQQDKLKAEAERLRLENARLAAQVEAGTKAVDAMRQQSIDMVAAMSTSQDKSAKRHVRPETDKNGGDANKADQLGETN